LHRKNNRPRFLNLWQIKLPLIGIVSIIHRVSGVFMLLLLPFLLYLLQLSLGSSDGFARASVIIAGWPVHLLGLLLLWLFAHHFFAGIRVMLIDLECGSGLAVARRTARWVLAAAVLVVIAGGLL
jgi:succinate dehydrogenase / fumarate reductase cytochrome b subunit